MNEQTITKIEEGKFRISDPAPFRDITLEEKLEEQYQLEKDLEKFEEGVISERASKQTRIDEVKAFIARLKAL